MHDRSTGLKELLQTKGEQLLAAPARALAVRWTLELSLAMGKRGAARELLEAETPQTLGMLPQPLSLPAYQWCLIQLAAGDGNYEEADEHLAALLALPKARSVTPSATLAQTVGHILLWEAPLPAGMPCQLLRAAPALLGLPPSRMATLVRGLKQGLLLLQQESDLLAVRGWLALERGDTRTGRTCLGQVLDHCHDGEPALTIPLRSGPLARLYSDWSQLSE